MKINSIRLERFRNHHDTRLDLDRLNVVTGRNNSGKSSVVMALEAALTGRCSATDKGGRGLADLIKLGSASATVTLDVDGLGTITRDIDPKGNHLRVAGWEGGVRQVQEMLYEHAEADADLIANLLNVSEFVALPAKEQQEMLFSLAGVGFTPEDLQAAAGDSWAVLAATWPIPEQVGPGDLDVAYKAVYAARTAAKKELAAAQGALGALEGEELPQNLPPAEELPAVRADLERVEAEHNALLRRIADFQSAARRLDELVRRRTELERKIADLGEVEYPADDTAGTSAELEEAMRDLETARQAAADFAGRIRGIDDSAKAIKKATSKCPIAPEHVKCPLSKEDRKALADKLDIARAKVVKDHEAAIKEQTAHAAGVEELRRRLEQIRTGAAAHEKYTELKGELDELTADAKELRVTDTDALEKEAAALAERISRGHAIIAQAEAAATKVERIQAAAGAVQDSQYRVECLEELVTLLGQGPEGMKARLLTSVIDDLSQRVSANLQQLTGGALRVGIMTDPDFHLLVDNGATCVEPKHLSTSERFRVGIAFAVELARMSRLGILVIDDAEILDAGNRAWLSGYLDSLADFDTIILLATKDECPPTAPCDGMTFWWVEGGCAERLDLVEVGV